MHEPMEELVQIRDFLRVVSHDNKLNGAEENADFSKLYYEQMVPNIVKRMTRERSNDDKYIEVVAEILEAFIVLFLEELKLKNFNQNFCEAMKQIFNYNSYLHKYSYQISDDDMKRYRTLNQTWRNELKVGDKVDVLIKADEKGMLQGWMQGEIESIDRDDLFIVFKDSHVFYDGCWDRWALEIAQFETRTKEDYEWRRS